MVTPMGAEPDVKSTLLASVEASILETGVVNVGRKKGFEIAVRLLTWTVIGANIAPVGTVVVNCVAVAALTVAFVAPKKTVLFAGVVLKFVPVMVTVAPTLPEVGVKEVIVGGSAMLWKTETLFEPLLEVMTSGFVSPSRSPMATQTGPLPVVKSTFVANEIVPEEPVFRKTDMVLPV